MLTGAGVATAPPPWSMDRDRNKSVIAWRGGQPKTLSDLMNDAASLAHHLPEGKYVVNYCADRYHFLAAFLGAAIRGQVSLLPSDRTAVTLQSLADRYQPIYAATDAPLEGGIVQECRVDLASNGVFTEAELLNIDQNQIVAEVFTSGTTGQPVGHVKTWGSLLTSGRLIASELGLSGGRPRTVVATVPVQHMYGLEMSIMLPIVTGSAAHEGQPFYPSDIVAALEAVPEPRILVTTPIHMRALVQENGDLPPLELIVSATDTLSVDLAARAEARFNTRVMEIYGCTEAGSLASRRPVDSETWRLFDEMSLTKENGAGMLRGPQLAHPVPLSDVIELVSANEFKLNGRSTDMIKIAGKRASLAGLNAVLSKVDGVLDGCFYLPPANDAGKAARLIAFVVAPNRSVPEIKLALRRRLDSAFVPRQIVRVPSLPRNPTGKLTASALNDLARQTAGSAKK